MPELSAVGQPHRGRRRRRGDVHDHRRPGAGRRTRRSATRCVGTAQPGTDFEPLLGTALLRAGQTLGVTVTLRSIQKDVVFHADRHDRRQLADPRRAGAS